MDPKSSGNTRKLRAHRIEGWVLTLGHSSIHCIFTSVSQPRQSINYFKTCKCHFLSPSLRCSQSFSHSIQVCGLQIIPKISCKASIMLLSELLLKLSGLFLGFRSLSVHFLTSDSQHHLSSFEILVQFLVPAPFSIAALVMFKSSKVLAS